VNSRRFGAGTYSRPAVFLKTRKFEEEPVMVKASAKLAIGAFALISATWFGTSPGHAAYGDAPWCAVINFGRGVYWDCQYQTEEQCAPNVIAGNRGFCNLNPWPAPARPLAATSYHKRHSKKAKSSHSHAHAS
jgi:hypothetical protein